MFHGWGLNCLLKTQMLKALLLLGDGGNCKKWGLMEGGQVINHKPCKACWDPDLLFSANLSFHETTDSACPLCHGMSCRSIGSKTMESVGHELNPVKPWTKINLFSFTLLFKVYFPQTLTVCHYHKIVIDNIFSQLKTIHNEYFVFVYIDVNTLFLSVLNLWAVASWRVKQPFYGS